MNLMFLSIKISFKFSFEIFIQQIVDIFSSTTSREKVDSKLKRNKLIIIQKN
jgi:hypothetical protein